MKTHRIGLLPGDGIGPDVVDATVRILKAVESRQSNLKLELVHGDAGLNSMAKHGTNVPMETIEMLRTTEACLKGPMTTSETLGSPPSAALQIRKTFQLYANARPCFSLPKVPSVRSGVDLVIVRENTEGLYSNLEFELAQGVAVALRVITRRASERVARFAFALATRRKKHVSYVHKANILRLTDGIFKQAVLDVAEEYPDVMVDDYHIDSAAAQLIKQPQAFDVIVTTNLFGDIISDEAAELVGGLGVAASGNYGDSYAMFEPVHGSAPKMKPDTANPLATIFAASMLLEYLDEKEAAGKIHNAVLDVLNEGNMLTADLGGQAKTSEISEAIVKKLE